MVLHEVVDPELRRRWQEMVREQTTRNTTDAELDAAEAEFYQYIRNQRRWPADVADPRAREWRELHSIPDEDLEAELRASLDLSEMSSRQIRALGDEQGLRTMERELREHSEQVQRAAQEARRAELAARDPKAEADELEALEAEIRADLASIRDRSGGCVGGKIEGSDTSEALT